MRTRSILAVSLLGLVALLSGCATTASTTATTSPSATPSATATPSASATPGSDGDTAPDVVFSGGWLASGTMIGVVTFGSSSCVPQVKSATGSGSSIRVTLVDPDVDQVCTMDMSQRITPVAVPEGIDVTTPLLVTVVYGAGADQVNIPAVTEPGDPTAMETSAGYVDANLIGLVTYGSSTCRPVVESAEPGTDSSNLVVTFAEPDPTRVCTEDFSPRVTQLYAENRTTTVTLITGTDETTIDVLANDF